MKSTPGAFLDMAGYVRLMSEETLPNPAFACKHPFEGDELRIEERRAARLITWGNVWIVRLVACADASDVRNRHHVFFQLLFLVAQFRVSLKILTTWLSSGIEEV